MGVLPVLDFKVKSMVNDYKVMFVDNAAIVLANEIKNGDVILIDSKIRTLYPEITHTIPKSNLVIEIVAHEKQKSYKGLIPIINKLIECGFRKNHRIIGIGGGITQDITAFTSSIIYRGVNWIFFPTTLLAQGDSCIGSKTSINFGQYKNQLGGFYPPNKIYIDINFIDSLSTPDLQSGFGEMCHYFVVAGEEDFKQYKKDYNKALTNKSVLANIISRSLAIKKDYIEIDEFDQNERQVFNYGHSFGHAIETLTNYEVPHGIAVSFGMDIANFISVKRKILDSKIRMDIKELLHKIYSGYDIKQINVNKLCNALDKDKKNINNGLQLILCKGYGKVFKTRVENDTHFKNLIAEYLNNELN